MTDDVPVIDNPYYQKQILLARVDEHDTVTGTVERWEAHERGVLHRGFTAILMHGPTIYMQHRKHPAFDGFWDLTFSSHPVYQGNRFQSDEEAIAVALEREWNLTPSSVTGKPVKLGSVYYRAEDPGSSFIEHEVDRVYLVRISREPVFDAQFAYAVRGFRSVAAIRTDAAASRFAPWVTRILDNIPLSG